MPAAVPSSVSVEPILLIDDYASDLIPHKIYDTRITAWPSPERIEQWSLPLLIHKSFTTKDEAIAYYDSLTAELDAIRALAAPSGRATPLRTTAPRRARGSQAGVRAAAWYRRGPR